MVEQQSRATRLVRAFGLFTLLAGVAVMHAVVFGAGHSAAASTHSGNHTAESMVPAATMAMTSDVATLPSTAMAATLGVMGTPMTMDMPGCGGDCGDGHAGLHGCLFVLTALLLGLGLALLAWVGLSRGGTAATKVRQLRPHRARPPPWTVLSLADLAILRI